MKNIKALKEEDCAVSKHASEAIEAATRVFKGNSGASKDLKIALAQYRLAENACKADNLKKI